MKKICVCVFVLWITCSKVFAAGLVPEYDTISPINLTIYSCEKIQGTALEERFTEALHHFAVAIYEATNGAHQLGRIKIIQKGNLDNKEFMHINWEPYFRDGIGGFFGLGGNPHAETITGTYIPHSQNAKDITHSIRMDRGFLRGRTTDIISKNQGPIDTGYTLAHESGHFIYGLFDEYEPSAPTGWLDSILNPHRPISGDSLRPTSLTGFTAQYPVGSIMV